MQSQNNEIALTKEDIHSFVEDKYSSLNDSRLQEEINSKLQSWQTGTEEFIASNNPFETGRLKLSQAKWDYKAHGADKKSIYNDLTEFKTFSPEIDTSFWANKLELNDQLKNKTKIKSDTLASIRRNELEAWEKEYDKKLLQWQLEEIGKRRKKLLKSMTEWLNILKELQDSFEELGLETGLLWDTSIGNLSKQDISLLKKWMEYLKSDEGVRQLCELMGRIQKEEKSHHTEIITSTESYTVTRPDIESNEEIVGIELGQDLENVIPQELALLSDPDTSLLFDLKFIENRLMCFSKQGKITETFDETIEKEVTVEDKDTQGPIIICVDTSGSMSGAPENIAKAITLTLSARAVAQNRKCYLINFSTSIDTLDLSPPKGMSELISFLQMSFHGGTDVDPALFEGVKKMKNEDYEKSDLLVISDFVISNLSSEIVTLCHSQKKKDNRFYALSIGNFHLREVMDDVFDQQWTYNDRTGSVSAINNIVEWMTSKR